MPDRDDEELWGLLREQKEFLERSADAFDRGYEAEAKRLATTLRLLVHDTNSSVSLLTQLGLKDQITYADTAPRFDPANLLPTNGLTMMRVENTPTAQQVTWVAPLNNLSPSRQQPDAPFDLWWEATVTKGADGVEWNRRRMVVDLANQDGGAHVDPTLTRRYERMLRGNIMGWAVVTSDGAQPMDGTPILASVRQIAYEMIKTLDEKVFNRLGTRIV